MVEKSHEVNCDFDQPTSLQAAFAAKAKKRATKAKKPLKIQDILEAKKEEMAQQRFIQKGSVKTRDKFDENNKEINEL